MEIRSAPAFVEYWRGFRGRTRRLVPFIPADRLEWSPREDGWTFGDLLRHLAGIERDMYAENVRLPLEILGPRVKHEEACVIFGALSPEQLAGKCATPAGTPITTYKWLRAMVEHEAHHRGQIYLMLGMLGIQPPQLYGLSEEEVRARSV